MTDEGKFKLEPKTDRQIELETRAFVAIGRFITAFSQLEFFLKVALAGVLQIKEEHYNAVVDPYDFSMLCTVTSAIFKQEAPEREADIEKVLSRCRALNNHRVRIAHGVWLHESYGLKARHISRQSLKPEFYYHDSEELERLTETAQQLKVEVIALWATASKN